MNILVYDLGGEIFDIILSCMGKDGDLTIITTRGDHYLGGRDWIRGNIGTLSIFIDKLESSHIA